MDTTREAGGILAGQAPDPQTAASDAVDPLTLTIDDASRPEVASLVGVLRARGVGVHIRTFLRTEDARGVVLLALRQPLPSLLALVAPPTASAEVLVALDEALFGARTAPATLQLKADDTFVSLNARDRADLAHALGDLGDVVAQLGRQAARTPTAGGERRLVYVDGVWQVFPDGARGRPALVYDAGTRGFVAP